MALPGMAHSAENSHWAFQPLVATKLPAKTQAVDHFVFAELEANGLEPSPQAEPAALLRRLYLDLVGLPPTPEAIDAFLADPSDAAFEAVVETLLASPRYGERWGRHWLDLARYADSCGLHEDADRPHAWRYRDYVIDSFNADKPYAQFIREQLAGDEIDPKNVAAWIATGFCRAGPSNEENVAPNAVEKYRMDQLDDMLSTTSTVFLGLTIACARCHDHKTEPFSQVDYYRLLAFFTPSVDARIPFEKGVMGEPVLLPVKARDKRKTPKTPSLRVLTDEGPVARATFFLERGDVNSKRDEVQPGVPEVLQSLPVEFPEPDRTTKRRTALADWIASPENPLTWRVMANRVWQHHFGRGLVPTPSNFGPTGQAPSHPELLDWLAARLRETGSVKDLHRQVVLSQAWKQSSDFDSVKSSIDPDNRWLWRFPRQRLEAEVIRDQILAASGKLNLKAGGPGIKPRIPGEVRAQSKRNQWPEVKEEGPEHWRRSVYVYVKRQLIMPMMELLDQPNPSVSCAERFTSTTPTQALAMLNDAFVNEQAAFLAERVRDETDPVKAMFRLALSSDPGEARLAEARQFANEHSLADLGVVLFNLSEFAYVD